MAQPDVFVIEVRVTKTNHDPQLQVYHVVVKDGKGEWRETYGSREQLQTYLRGLETMLRMTGYQVALLGWDQPDSWNLPFGKLWTIPQVGKGDPMIEDLDHDGAVMIDVL